MFSKMNNALMPELWFSCTASNIDVNMVSMLLAIDDNNNNAQLCYFIFNLLCSFHFYCSLFSVLVIITDKNVLPAPNCPYGDVPYGALPNSSLLFE